VFIFKTTSILATVGLNPITSRKSSNKQAAHSTNYVS